jgi:hypothetical protein
VLLRRDGDTGFLVALGTHMQGLERTRSPPVARGDVPGLAFPQFGADAGESSSRGPGEEACPSERRCDQPESTLDTGADTHAMTPPETLAVLSGLIAAGSTVGAAILVVRLHFLPTGVDAMREGVSGYALGKWARLYRAQVIGCGVAAVLIVIGCCALGVGSLAGLAALVVYAAARFAIVRYPTDPPGTIALSTTGRTHALLAATAFLSLAAAAPMLGLSLAARPPWDQAAPILAAVSLAVPVTVVATFAAGGWPPLRPLFGLIERTVYVTGLLWLFVVSLGLAASPLATQAM